MHVAGHPRGRANRAEKRRTLSAVAQRACATLRKPAAQAAQLAWSASHRDRFRFFAPGSPIARLSSSMIFHETMLNFGSELNF